MTDKWVLSNYEPARMNDIAKRAKARAAALDAYHDLDQMRALTEAAAEIERLEADNARLRAALRGVLRVADRKTDEFDEARAALEQKK